MHPLARTSLLLLSLAWLAIARPVLAAWPHDPSAGNLGVTATGGSQQTPASVSDGAGGVIIAWTDSRTGLQDIYAQRFNASGVPMWGSTGLAVCTASFGQYDPAIASDGAGGAIIVWVDQRSLSQEVYAQRVSGSGVAQWAANGVAVCDPGTYASFPAVAADGSGGAIIVWEKTPGPYSDIASQRINASGVSLWSSTGVLICSALFSQFSPVVTPDGSGGAYVAWRDERAVTGAYVQRVNGAGAAQWVADGIRLNSGSSTADSPAIASDGRGGVIAAWSDDRSASPNRVFVQRFTSGGFAQWASGGVPVCPGSGAQYTASVDADGTGGCVVTWRDARTSVSIDVFAQRVGADGVRRWTDAAVAVAVAANDQDVPKIVSDGKGGACITWFDARSGNYDIWAQRVSAAGAPMWAANGVALCTMNGTQRDPVIVGDGSGGAIVAWRDERDPLRTQVFAQRVEPFGYLGNPEPRMASVRDVPNDQGGKVKVSWYASYLDTESDPVLAYYDVYRSVPGSVATAAVRAGAREVTDFSAPAPAGTRTFVRPASAALYAWEYVTSAMPTHFLNAYGVVVSTTGDSIAGSNPRTAFMVVARNLDGSRFWLSAADSGYSVDNLPPATPAPFTGTFAQGVVALHWDPNAESDVAGYRLYRGTSLAFVPGPSSLVATPESNGWVAAAQLPYVYKLTAIDSHGNESPAAVLVPSGTLDAADGAPPAHAFFALASANPSRAGAPAALRFGLASAGHVSVALFDAHGRRVRELASGPRTAGTYALTWDGRDSQGEAAAPGLYFVRATGPGMAATIKLVVHE